MGKSPKFSDFMNGTISEHRDEPIVERQSLDTKREHIVRWAEEALEGLRSGNFILCDKLKMPFGTFLGVKVIGKYANGLNNTYYFGMVDGMGSATGRADLEDRKGTVWVQSYGVYDAIESSLSSIDGFQQHASKVEGFDAGEVIFAFSEGEKKVLYHELSHVYDLMVRGVKGVSSTEHRWSTRPEEIEAELNALYNAMLADESLTLKDFESSLTPDHYGIGSADGRYDTMVGPLYGWAERHPEKVKISHKKILRRWVDMRQMVMDKLGKKVESRKKFSDLMNEMPAWNDASKSLSDDISGVEPVMDVVNNKEDGGFGMLDQFEIGEYVVWVMERGRGRALCCVVGYKGKVHVGEFDWYLNPFGWTTESAVVHKDHQGRGIAFGVYKYMIEHHMTTLYSDNHLTGEEGKGSFDIWAKLGRTFPYKYVYDSIEDIAEEVDGFTRDMMGDSDKLFVVSTEDILEDA